MIENEKKSIDSSRQALSDVITRLKSLETSSLISQKQEELKQAQEEYTQARRAYEACWRSQSRIPVSSLRHHTESLVKQAEEACIHSLQSAGYTPSQTDSPSEWLATQHTSLKQSIAGLTVDNRRIKQELIDLSHSLGCTEGQLISLKQQKQDLQNLIQDLCTEIQSEYLELGIQTELSDEGLSAVINSLVYHTDSIAIHVTLSTAILTTLNKHYLLLQLQEKESILLPQLDSLTNQMTVTQYHNTYH